MNKNDEKSTWSTILAPVSLPSEVNIHHFLLQGYEDTAEAGEEPSLFCL